MPRVLSLAVVGVDHPNKDKSNRRFEITMCDPGEPVELRPEPKNPVDPQAIGVFSSRGTQLGYVTAERCGWILSMIKAGREVRSVFQSPSSFGAWIRLGLDGAEPTLPIPSTEPTAEQAGGEDTGFWPDYIPPDD